MKTPMAFCLIALTIISSSAFAQKGPFFQFGLKAGANLTKVDGKSLQEEFKYGYTVGAFTMVKIGDGWHLQPEVSFNQYNTQTGSEFSTVYEGGTNLKDIRLNYLSIPLLLDYSPTRFFTFQGGPQYGILMSKDRTVFEDGQAAFKQGDFSLIGGVQLNIKKFKASGRYVLGLSNINDIDNRERWKNQGFQVTIGMRII